MIAGGHWLTVNAYHFKKTADFQRFFLLAYDLHYEPLKLIGVWNASKLKGSYDRQY